MRGKGLPAIPILGISFAGASPTTSAVQLDDTYVYPTVDVARQYDGLGGDFPVRPLNLLALANALLGYHQLHGETIDVPFDQALYQGREGDTSYYLVETDIVPILQPLDFFIREPILKAIDAPLRVIIEDAYDRGIGPGTPTPFNWRPTNDGLALAGKLIRSMPVAVDNLVEGFGGSRVLGTEAPGPFGVGGLDLPDEPPGVRPAEAVQAPQDPLTSDRVRADDVVTDADLSTTATTEAAGAADALMARGTDTDEPGVGAEELEAEDPALPDTDPETASEPPDTDVAHDDPADDGADDDSGAEAT